MVCSILLPLPSSEPIFGATKSVITFSINVIIFTIIGVTVITVQPYKSEYSCYNTVDASLFLILGTSVIALDTAQEKAQYFVTPAKMVILTIPLIYIILVVLYGIYCKCKGNCFNFEVTQRMITYEREPIWCNTKSQEGDKMNIYMYPCTNSVNKSILF